MHGASSRVFGIDIWKEAIFQAAARKRFYGLRNTDLIAGDASMLPFPNNQFDLIVSNLGLNNFADPVKALAECRRVAKPQAIIVLTTNIMGHYREFYEIFRDLLLILGNSHQLANLAANEEHRGTEESVSLLIESAGFTPTRIIREEFQLRFLDGTCLLDHALTRIGFLAGWHAIVDGKDRAGVFSALEKKLNEIAAKQGRLTMTVPMLYLEARAG